MVLLWGTLALAAGLTLACENVPLLAPSGSTIILTASTNAMSANATTDIIAQVLEPAGTAPHSGTLIIFTTTLGSIEPVEARTDINGRTIVKFHSGSANGTAVIMANSGGATTTAEGAVRIAIGTAAAGRVSINAAPATVPNTGGTSTISATVFDINGNLLRAAPVSFATTTGTLSASVVPTDANGVASTVLTTSQEADVTATVGATAPATPPPTGGGTPGNGGGTTPGTGSSSGPQSATVKVKIAIAPTILITPPTNPPASVGLPAVFEFAVTVPAGACAVRDVRVTWGDGTSNVLGAITGTARASHVYSEADSFTVSAVLTDACGNTVSVSTSVTVIPVPRPTIVVTPTPQHADGQRDRSRSTSR